MRNVVFLGDIHANFSVLTNVRKRYPNADEIIVVGDFGYGFPNRRSDDKYHNYHQLRHIVNTFTDTKVRFVRGNHDNLDAILSDFPMGNVEYIPDGTIEDDVLYVGGAWSIDGVTGVWPNSRLEGIDWWKNEELTDDEWEALFESLKGREEEITMIVSHDFPKDVFSQILPNSRYYNTRTQERLSELWKMLPNVKLWVGGHYHVSRRFEQGGTQFVVLNCDGVDTLEVSL